ncbi:MAG: hypothetical protein N2C12_10360 [Planctomycetales bacterium]
MRTVELLEQTLDIARQLGYRVREECVGGNGGGSCVVRGQKWLFLDPSFDISDQLALACDAIQSDPAIHSVHIPPGLAKLLLPVQRKAA